MGRISMLASLLVLVPVAHGAAADLAQLPDLIRDLNSDDAGTKSSALYHLRGLGLDAAAALPEIIRALDDPDKGIRKQAADALAAIGPEAVEALIRALRHKEGQVQWHAIRALGGLGADAAPAVPALCKMLKSREVYVYPEGHANSRAPVAAAAAEALGRIGPAAESAMPSLLAAVRDTEFSYIEFTIPRKTGDTDPAYLRPPAGSTDAERRTPHQSASRGGSVAQLRLPDLATHSRDWPSNLTASGGAVRVWPTCGGVRHLRTIRPGRKCSGWGRSPRASRLARSNSTYRTEGCRELSRASRRYPPTATRRRQSVVPSTLSST